MSTETGFELFAAPVSQPVFFKVATEGWEVRAAQRLRRAVFCIEQGLFAGDDRDAQDDDCEVLVALVTAAGVDEEVVGTVRLHAHGRDRWSGSRLAVHPSFRRCRSVGSGLVRFAVARAKAHGAQSFDAVIQAQNVELFERLGWQKLAPCTLHGRPHYRMAADLGASPTISARALWGYRLEALA